MSKPTHWRMKVQEQDNFLKYTLPGWRASGDRIVFTNGCFDILHAGHIENLAQAAALGERLVVAVNSDASVNKLKEEGRPVQNENDRCLLLASCAFTDAVLLFDEDTPLKLIEAVSPDFLVKGGDYLPDQIAGCNHVLKKGGSLVLLPLVPGKSTTRIVNKIKKL